MFSIQNYEKKTVQSPWAWFTKGLAKSKRKKYKLYQSFLNTPYSSTENADNLYESFFILFELQSVYIIKKIN